MGLRGLPPAAVEERYGSSDAVFVRAHGADERGDGLRRVTTGDGLDAVAFVSAAWVAGLAWFPWHGLCSPAAMNLSPQDWPHRPRLVAVPRTTSWREPLCSL